MVKKAYILEEIERNGFTIETKVYGSKARAIKAFTEEVNHRIAYDYFKDADGKADHFFEAEKKLKELNEWYNVHTTHHTIVTRPYDEKKWWAVLFKESAVALEFEDSINSKYMDSRIVDFTFIENGDDEEYDTVLSATLEEVELR